MRLANLEACVPNGSRLLQPSPRPRAPACFHARVAFPPDRPPMQLLRVHSPRPAPLQSSFVEVSLARFRAQDPCLGFGPPRDITGSVYLPRRLPSLRYVPSPGVRSLSTVYSTPSSAGLFHPAAASRAHLSRGFSLRAADLLIGSRAAPMPLAHRALSNRSHRPRSACLDFEALLRAKQRHLGYGY